MGRGTRMKEKTNLTPSDIYSRNVRSFSLNDLSLFTPILDLVNTDRLQGQPVCNEEMLKEALRGRSPIDNAYWQELKELHHIYSSEAGKINGALAYGIRKDKTGVILWSHTKEDPKVTKELISQALTSLKSCDSIEAFPHASALGTGLEGLPSSRNTTDKVLKELGFDSEDLWLYMNCRITEEDKSIPLDEEIDIDETKDSSLPGQRYFNLKTKNDLALAEFSMNKDTGTLWWIEVKDEAKGKGLGRKLVKQMKNLAASNGVKQIILYVDHDEPDNPERDRRPAVSLYLSEGWQEVDHLNSYSKTNNPEVIK